MINALMLKSALRELIHESDLHVIRSEPQTVPEHILLSCRKLEQQLDDLYNCGRSFDRKIADFVP